MKRILALLAVLAFATPSFAQVINQPIPISGGGGTGSGGQVDATGHLLIGKTTNVPTIASGACGTALNGTISTGGNDQSFIVNIGAATTTTCAVSFGATWATKPRACVFSPASTASAAFGTTVPFINPTNITTTGVTLSGTALATTAWLVHCY